MDRILWTHCMGCNGCISFQSFQCMPAYNCYYMHSKTIIIVLWFGEVLIKKKIVINSMHFRQVSTNIMKLLFYQKIYTTGVTNGF